MSKLVIPVLLSFLAATGALATDDATTAVEILLADDSLDFAAFSDRLTGKIAPADLVRVFSSRHDLVPPVLQRLADAWTTQPEIGAYLSRCARDLSRQIAAAGPPWADDDLDLLLTVQLVHPLRFVEGPSFRAKVLAMLPGSFDPGVPGEITDRILVELNRVRGFGFEDSERVELAWGAVPRTSANRQVTYENSHLRLPGRPQGPIEASIYSLPSRYFSAEEAERFLTVLEDRTPARRLIVLTDLSLQPGDRVTRIETHGRDYSPWPRDPLLFARRQDGDVVVVQRPNLQPEREDDSNLGRELIQGLPADLDRAWGNVRWTTAPVPFHNGQVLLTDETAWLSIHSLEPRILEILGLDRIPVASFSTAAGIERYLGAARDAAAELEELYRRPPRFVHPLPDSGPVDERAAVLRQIGGGAGFDLDSYLTLVPGAGGPPTALVADLAAGVDLLRQLPANDWQRLHLGYRLRASSAELPAILSAYRSESRVERLRIFLDLVAEHLGQQELDVHRLPHFLVPTSLLPEHDELDYPDFQITWNNVVIENLDDRIRAEGFSSLLEIGDAAARRAFEQAGCRLELLPPLVPSIVRNGGYRCASNHLRANHRPGQASQAGFIRRRFSARAFMPE